MQTKPAIVGGFVLSGLALGVAVILLFGGRHFFSPQVPAVVYFHESVANLDIGAPVTFRGVRVGTVSRISVDLNMTDLTARIPVFLDLNPAQIFLDNGVAGQSGTDFEHLLKAGLRAQLSVQSLITGQLRIDLDLLPGTVGVTVGDDQSRPEIPTIPSKLQTLESEIANLPLKEAVENVGMALAAIQILADSLKQTSDTAKTALDGVNLLILNGNRQLTANGEALTHVLASSDMAVRDTQALITSLNALTGPQSQMQSDVRSAVRDLAASAGSLRTFTHDIERDPSVILSGRVSQ